MGRHKFGVAGGVHRNTRLNIHNQRYRRQTDNADKIDNDSDTVSDIDAQSAAHSITNIDLEHDQLDSNIDVQNDHHASQ